MTTISLQLFWLDRTGFLSSASEYVANRGNSFVTFFGLGRLWIFVDLSGFLRRTSHQEKDIEL
jgi:hypothetical protein